MQPITLHIDHDGVYLRSKRGAVAWMAAGYEQTRIQDAEEIITAVNAHDALVNAVQLLMKAEPMQAGERNGCIMGQISLAIDAARTALAIVDRHN